MKIQTQTHAHIHKCRDTETHIQLQIYKTHMDIYITQDIHIIKHRNTTHATAD